MLMLCGPMQVQLQKSGLNYTCLYTWSSFEAEDLRKPIQYNKQPHGSIALTLPIFQTALGNSTLEMP